jgi:hypothetical protein
MASMDSMAYGKYLIINKYLKILPFLSVGGRDRNPKWRPGQPKKIENQEINQSINNEEINQ